MNFLLKTIGRRDRRPNFVIFAVLSASAVGGWVVLVWSRKSYLRLVEIASYVFLVSLKVGRRRVSSIFHLFDFNVNQGNEGRWAWPQG